MIFNITKSQLSDMDSKSNVYYSGDIVIKLGESIEAESYKKLGSHYNLPTYYGTISSIPNSIVMENIKNSKPINYMYPCPSLYCKIMRQLIDVVSYIHSKGIIHTDLCNPENILYQEDTGRIVIIDFEGRTDDNSDSDSDNMKYDYRCIAYKGLLILDIRYSYTIGGLRAFIESQMKEYITCNNNEESTIMKELLLRML